MREGWEYKKLGDSCVIEYGTRVVQKKDGGTIYPVYGGGGETFRMDKYNRENCLVVARFAMSRTCVRYVKGKFFLNDSGLSINAGKELLQSYLNHHILHLNDDIYNLGKGAAQRNLDVNSFRNLIIAIPPLSTQLSIVSELDKINELIRLKKEQLKDYENLAQSIFYEMFGDPVVNEKGWEERTMQDLCVNIVDCPHSTPKKVDYITDYPCIRTSELRGGSISWATMQYLDEDEYNIRIARLKPEAGDIVFGREGTIGDAVILPLGYNFSLGQRTMLLRADTSIVSNIFLHRIILSDWIKHQIEYVNVSSTVAHVNIKDFKKFTVPLPPLPLQQLFAQRIKLIEKQKAEVQRTIADLETLLASRMQYWFD